MTGGVTGHVAIQRGCDRFCTFCVVPFTRGRERETPPEEVVRQVRGLAEAGFREVQLVGQTVNSYCFRQGDREIMRVLADQLAAAIERSRLLLQVQQRLGQPVSLLRRY